MSRWRRQSPGSLDISMFNSSPELLISAMLDVKSSPLRYHDFPGAFVFCKERVYIFSTRQSLVVGGDFTMKGGRECEDSPAVCLKNKKSALKFKNHHVGLIHLGTYEADLDVPVRIKSPLMNTDCCSLPAARGSTKLPGM